MKKEGGDNRVVVVGSLNDGFSIIFIEREKRQVGDGWWVNGVGLVNDSVFY